MKLVLKVVGIYGVVTENQVAGEEKMHRKGVVDHDKA